MTALGDTIYSKTLESEVARMDFEVVSWGKNSAYIFGFWYERDEYSYNRHANPDGIVAALSLDFETKTPIEVQKDFFQVKLPEFPRHVSGHFKRKLLPLDVHEELILAYGNRISLIPYPCLHFAVEGRPSSFAIQANTTTLLLGAGPQAVGVSIKHVITPNIFVRSNSNANKQQLGFSYLPEGATFDAETGILVWEPSDDQFGTHELVSTISFANGGIGACHIPFSLNVSEATVPSHSLPFEPSHLVVNEMETVAVAWVFREQSSSDDIEHDHTHLSLIRLQEGPAAITSSSITLTTDFFFEIDEAYVTTNRLILVEGPRSGTYDTYKLHILNMTGHQELELLKTFYVRSTSHISISVKSSHLRINYYKTEITLDLNTFERKVHKFYDVSSDHNNDNDPPIREGVIRNGILYSPTSGKPLLLLDPGPFVLDSERPSWSSRYNNLRDSLHEAQQYIRGQPVVAFYKADVVLQLEITVKKTGSGSYYDRDTDRYSKAILWVLDWDGNILGAKTIQAETLDPGASESKYNDMSTVFAARDHVYVSFRDQLLRFSAGDFSDEKLHFGVQDPTDIITSGNSDEERVRFEAFQTKFCVKGQDQYVLQHKVLGGEGPFDFFLYTEWSQSGSSQVPESLEESGETPFKLDNATGDVFVDGPLLMERARYSLAQHFEGQSGAASTMLSAVRKGSEPSFYIDRCLGESDLPVSHTIRMQVVDQTGDTATLDYHVVIGVPYDEVITLLAKMEANNSSPSADVCECPCSSIPNSSTVHVSPTSHGSAATNRSSNFRPVDDRSGLPLSSVDPPAATTKTNGSAIISAGGTTLSLMLSPTTTLLVLLLIA